MRLIESIEFYNSAFGIVHAEVYSDHINLNGIKMPFTQERVKKIKENNKNLYEVLPSYYQCMKVMCSCSGEYNNQDKTKIKQKVIEELDALPLRPKQKPKLKQKKK